ncbi:MAG: hypothetical protein N2202_03235 [Proteobacteria bacterium]|nr:hypothetical protein [Pseudomonadota bacterium]
MKKIFILILLIFSNYVYADDFNNYYLKAEKVANEFYPKLKSYKCDVKTSQFEIMMNKMTASMPKDMPRPEKPELKKYWHHKKGMVIVLEGKNVFPYMQEFSKKMISQYALELHGFFLPVNKKKERDALLANSKKIIEFKGDEVVLSISFIKPIFIDGLFFKTGLPLPTDDVKALSFNIDKDRGLVKRMTVVSGGEKEIKYEVIAEYENKEGHNLLKVLNLKTSDSSVVGKFVTEFGKINGYFLPIKQVRTLEGKDISEENKNIVVEFTNYLLNKKIPERVYKDVK